MSINRFLVFLVLMTILGCKTTKVLEHFSLQKETKVMLKEEGLAEFFYWEFNNDKSLWQSILKHFPDLGLYRDSVRMVLGLEKFAETIKKESTQSVAKSLIENEENGDRINALLVHTGTLGKIRSINLLEAQILDYQISKFPLLALPTEFHGFITIHQKTDKVRIYFASSDAPWPPKPNVIIKALEKDIQNGWLLKYHLHNHYEEVSNNYLGILAPSLADAQYYKMLSERFNLDKALITNGFHTVEISNNEFDKFESH